MKLFNAKRLLIKALTIIWLIALPVFLYDLGLILWESYISTSIDQPALDYFQEKARISRVDIESQAFADFRKIENPKSDTFSFFTKRFIRKQKEKGLKTFVVAYYKHGFIKSFEIVYGVDGSALFVVRPGEFSYFRETYGDGDTIDLTIPPNKRGL